MQLTSVPRLIYPLVFLVIFAGIHVALALTFGTIMKLWWVNLIYLGFVLLSMLFSNYIVFKGVSWAVFPYSNTIVALNH